MLALILSAAISGTAAQPAPKSEPYETATMCMKKGEYSSGMNKICIYDCMGSDAAITIGAVELCPLTIDQ